MSSATSFLLRWRADKIAALKEGPEREHRRQLFERNVRACFVERDTEARTVLDPQSSPSVVLREVEFARRWLELSPRLEEEVLSIVLEGK